MIKVHLIWKQNKFIKTLASFIRPYDIQEHVFGNIQLTMNQLSSFLQKAEDFCIDDKKIRAYINGGHTVEIKLYQNQLTRQQINEYKIYEQEKRYRSKAKEQQQSSNQREKSYDKKTDSLKNEIYQQFKQFEYQIKKDISKLEETIAEQQAFMRQLSVNQKVTKLYDEIRKDEIRKDVIKDYKQNPQFQRQQLNRLKLSQNQKPSHHMNQAKIVLLIDGTSSMGLFFQKLKLFILDVFKTVEQTLKINQLKGKIQMQIAIYRNYNSNIDKLLQYSCFDSQGKKLKQFLNATKVEGGWQNQAVQVALQYINSLNQVDEVIIIGDAKANQNKQIPLKRMRNYQQEKERVSKGMTETTFEKQLQNIIEKKVPVNSLYLNNSKDIEKFFSTLSMQTKGESKYINIRQSFCTNKITDFIVTRAVRLIEKKEQDKIHKK